MPSLSTVGAGAVAGGAAAKEREMEAGRERERDGGVGALTVTPRGGAAWILQTRVRGRARAQPRGGLEEHKRTGGGSRWWLTDENNEFCKRLHEQGARTHGSALHPRLLWKPTQLTSMSNVS